MKLIRQILGFLIAAVILAFAIMNRQQAEIIWSPFHDPAHMPLYFLILVSMALGFVLGGIIVWFGGGRVRSEKRRQKRQIKDLEKELEEVQSETSPDPASEMFPALPKRRQS